MWVIYFHHLWEILLTWVHYKTVINLDREVRRRWGVSGVMSYSRDMVDMVLCFALMREPYAQHRDRDLISTVPIKVMMVVAVVVEVVAVKKVVVVVRVAVMLIKGCVMITTP